LPGQATSIIPFRRPRTRQPSRLTKNCPQLSSFTQSTSPPNSLNVGSPLLNCSYQIFTVISSIRRSQSQTIQSCCLGSAQPRRNFRQGGRYIRSGGGGRRCCEVHGSSCLTSINTLTETKRRMHCTYPPPISSVFPWGPAFLCRLASRTPKRRCRSL
jgi:hypothetical protein